MASSGGTPFFTYAGAGVVNTGGVMSHAAIIGPRTPEFEIPFVVGSKTGSRVLRTEHVVEVDGGPDVSRHTGRVTPRAKVGALVSRRSWRLFSFCAWPVRVLLTVVVFAPLRMNGVSVGTRRFAPRSSGRCSMQR